MSGSQSVDTAIRWGLVIGTAFAIILITRWAVSSLAVGFSGISAPSVLTSALSPGISVFGTRGVILVGVILAGIAIAADQVARLDGVDSQGAAGSMASAIRALGVVLFAIVVYFAIDSPSDLLSFWWVPVLLVIGYVGYVYAQHRRNVATSSTAVSRTRRTTQRDIESWAELGVGIFVLALAVVFALLSGVMTGLTGLGEVLLPFAPEFSYLATVVLGFVSIGGSMPLDHLIPELTAFQYAAIALTIGGIALIVKQ